MAGAGNDGHNTEVGRADVHLCVLRPSSPAQGEDSQPHLLDEETEAQRRQVAEA